jgi:hypothetical protein
LSLEKIFEISSIINQGYKISDIVNISEIKEFLDGVFRLHNEEEYKYKR